jgi:hypothetical protein
MSVISLVAPSAVWIRLMASPAFLTAWFKLRIWCVMRVAIDKPAASSRAELMRLPVDSCCIATVMLRSVDRSAACENNAFEFVLMTAIFLLLTQRVYQTFHSSSTFCANSISLFFSGFAMFFDG